MLIKADTQDWVEEIVRLVQNEELFYDKAERAYCVSGSFSMKSFRSKILAMEDHLKDKSNNA